jgi:hypothetical protein
MKFKIKALDENITLFRIPFDAGQLEAVQEALATLGSNPQEIAKVVTLSKRTNKNLYFTFKGTESQLKPFFEQYYSSMSWEKIREKYKQEFRKDKEDKDENEDEDNNLFLKIKNIFKDLFIISSENIKIYKINEKQYEINLLNFKKERYSEIFGIYDNYGQDVIKKLKKLDFILSKKNPDEGNNPLIEKTKASFWIEKM